MWTVVKSYVKNVGFWWVRWSSFWFWQSCSACYLGGSIFSEMNGTLLLSVQSIVDTSRFESRLIYYHRAPCGMERRLPSIFLPFSFSQEAVLQTLYPNSCSAVGSPVKQEGAGLTSSPIILPSVLVRISSASAKGIDMGDSSWGHLEIDRRLALAAATSTARSYSEIAFYWEVK